MKKMKVDRVPSVKNVPMPKKGWHKRDYGGNSRSGVSSISGGGASRSDIIDTIREDFVTWGGVYAMWLRTPTSWGT